MMRSKFLLSFLISFILFLGTAIFTSVSLAAPRIYLSPAALTTTKDTDFEIQVDVDTDGVSVFGSDVYLNFSSSELTVKSITNGAFFTDFSSASSASAIEIHGFFSTLFDSKSGTGTIAKIVFTPKLDTGGGNITFTCQGDSATTLLDANGTNVLSCGVLNQSSLTYSGASATSSPTATPGTGGSTNPPQGEPNACGGTCGTNYNCQAGFYCYKGFCRNPACSTDTDCVCGAGSGGTKTPTPKPTKKALPTPKGTPQVVALTPYTPPSPLPSESPQPTEAPASEPLTSRILALGGRIGLGLLAVAVLISAIVWLVKRRNQPPSEGETITPVPPPTTPPPPPSQ